MTTRGSDQLAALLNKGSYKEGCEAHEHLIFAMGALRDSAPLHHSPTFDLFSSHERAQHLQDAFNKFQAARQELEEALRLFARAYPQFDEPPKLTDKDKEHRQKWREFFKREEVPAIE